MKLIKTGVFIMSLALLAIFGFGALRANAIVTTGITCSYAVPPTGCNYVPGPSYDPATSCGMVLSCVGQAPVISLLSPLQGVTGDTISIYGTSFTTNTSILLDGAPINLNPVDITLVSGGLIMFKIPANTSLGMHNIQVLEKGSSFNASAAVTLTVVATSKAPTISSVAPASATAGSTVYVYGTNYNQYTFVAIDGYAGTIPATTLVSSTVLSFVVPQLNPGIYKIAVNEKGSSFPLSSAVPLTVVAVPQAPTISYVSPASVTVGSTVYVYGSNFNGGNTYLAIDGGSSYPTFSFVSGTLMSFVVPALSTGAHTLAVSEKGSSFGLSAPVTFAVIAASQAPMITSLNPITAKIGDVVTAYGSNFDQNTFLYFDTNNGMTVIPTVVSSSVLTFVVPQLALGNHGLYVNEKAANFPTGTPVMITVLPSATQVPTITSTNPSSATVGSNLTVNLANGGFAGSVILKNLDGSKSWYAPYTTGTIYRGFSYYDGSKVSFTFPTMIGRGQLPENSGYETPSLITPGTYNLFVNAISGSTSNSQSAMSAAFPITVTIPSLTAPTILGISGPQALRVSQEGTWTIKASGPTDGNLSYSVDWGDVSLLGAGAARQVSSALQQTAVFTHTYGAAGVYTPVFTVATTDGQTTKASLSVNVGETIKVPGECEYARAPAGYHYEGMKSFPVCGGYLVNDTSTEASTASSCLNASGYNSKTGKKCEGGSTSTGGTPLPADVDTQKVQGACLDLQNNLRYRTRDASVNNEVSSFQDFLQTNGFLGSEPTGFFGMMTFKATKNFQMRNGISPTGFIGSLTRAKIKALTCSL